MEELEAYNKVKADGRSSVDSSKASVLKGGKNNADGYPIIPATVPYGDKAKLISSNYAWALLSVKGFIEGEQAAGIGFEVTQKAHNALRWLS